MFVDKFQLKKTAWHCRLMKYTWGLNHYDFSHICPYFWLSIFNVIISPLFLPLKFFFRTLLPRYIWKYIKMFLKWAYKYIEKWMDQFGDYLDKQAIAAQERWEANRQREIAALDIRSKQITRFFQLPTTTIELFQQGHQGEAYRELAQTEKYGSRGYKKLNKWFTAFKKLHETKPDFWENFLKKREEYLETLRQESLQEQTERNLREIALKQIRDRENEEKQKRLQYKAAQQDLEDMKAHARKLAKEEKLKLGEPARLAREARLADIRAANKRRIVRLLKICKPIATGFIWLLGGIIAIIGIYLLYLGIKWIANTTGEIPHSFWVHLGITLKWVGGIIGGGLVLVAIVGGIVVLIRKLPKPKVKRPKVRNPFVRVHVSLPELGLNRKLFRPIGRMFKYVWRIMIKSAPYLLYTFYPFFLLWKGMVWFGKGTKLFFIILFQAIKNNCPAIEWQDK